VSFQGDRSHSLKFTFGDQNGIGEDIWTKVLEYFLDESPKYFRLYSGVNHWRSDRVRTQSNFDENTIRLFFNGLSFVATPDRLMKSVALNEKFIREKRRYLHYLDGIPEDYVNKIFRLIAARLISVPYSNIAVEITNDKALFFELRFSNDLVLHFKVILASDLKDLKAFFALYKDTVCLDNGVGPLNEVVNHLTKLNAGVPTGFITK
jgi:hypothetical protein